MRFDGVPALYYKGLGFDSDGTKEASHVEKARLSALFLCIWLGMFGAHRFYAGKMGTGIVWFLTFGCFFIGYILDLILILTGQFYDASGKPVMVWMRRVDGEGKVQDHLV
ncbi:MAG: TM2 domain-containing protein [Candidatus Aminicenantales bacterium]